MPKLSGDKAIKIIRNEINTPHLLSYALSADAFEGAEDHFISLGFDGYISNPINKSTIEKVLFACVRRKTTTLA